MNKKGTLFLIPGLLGEGDPRVILGPQNLEVISGLRYFIVENQKNAIRFLVSCGFKSMIDQCEFGILNEHTRLDELNYLAEPLSMGQDAGILSDAGCPGIADPGAEIVSIAHATGVKVIPLSGPSSIILALMGSGLNGQSFSFLGYLPAKPGGRIAAIREVEARSIRLKQTQIFIEAPYRNNQLAQDLVKSLKRTTRLCIAANLMMSDQFLLTRTIADWENTLPDLNKIPAVFLILA